MPNDLTEIIRDLNVTIADTETFAASLPNKHEEMTRAVGQLKAARASLIRTSKDKEIILFVTSQEKVS